MLMEQHGEGCLDSSKLVDSHAIVFWNLVSLSAFYLLYMQWMGCWCGYLSGARCRLFEYGPADATAIPKSHHVLPHLNPDCFCFFGTGLPGCPGKEAVKWV